MFRREIGENLLFFKVVLHMFRFKSLVTMRTGFQQLKLMLRSNLDKCVHNLSYQESFPEAFCPPGRSSV